MYGTQPISDIEFMKTPSKWPAWPFLPLRRIRIDDFPETGYLIECKGKLTTVIRANVYEKPNVETVGELYSKYPTIEYNSFEAIFNDGWRVD